MHIVECLGGEDFIDSVAHDHCCDVMSAQASYLIVCDEQVIKVLVSLAMIERASEIQSIEVVSATALQASTFVKMNSCNHCSQCNRSFSSTDTKI